MVTPKITSVNQHSAEIGKQAANTFLKYIENDTIEQRLNKIILTAELIVRDSSNKKTSL
jgi:LacI family transcriptional regulator